MRPLIMYSSNPACHSMAEPLPVLLPLSLLLEGKAFIQRLRYHFIQWHKGQPSEIETLLEAAAERRITLCYFDDNFKFTITLHSLQGNVELLKLEYDL
jgi:hypothetical protein